MGASTHLFCHPKANVFCPVGTRSAKAEALHFALNKKCTTVQSEGELYQNKRF